MTYHIIKKFTRVTTKLFFAKYYILISYLFISVDDVRLVDKELKIDFI